MTKLRIRGTYDLDSRPCTHSQGALGDRRSAVYICSGATSRIVYIGRSDRVGKRLKAHRRKPWWPQVTDVQIMWCCCLNIASRVESDLIYKHQPPNQTIPRKIADVGKGVPTHLARLVEERLRLAEALPPDEPDLRGWLRAHREPFYGVATPWRDIATVIRSQTGERVTDTSVRSWWNTYQSAQPPSVPPTAGAGPSTREQA